MSQFKEAALAYHEFPVPGKIATHLTKPTETQEDLALAYSPGVAEPVKAIVRHPDDVYRYTQKRNLIGVITNGTAVLGLGHVGALASKPVMEGKALLFKKLADIDAFDLEINETDPYKFIEIVAALEPTFGGINLEDIKGPDCFIIEQALKERMNIPVVHDDQHGTAITLAAALKNALFLQKKTLKNIKIVCVGAGAAGLACMELLVSRGCPRHHIFLFDSQGLVTQNRNDLNDYKRQWAQPATEHTSLSDVMQGADVFIGLSVAGLLDPSCLKAMNKNPIVFAMANPDPEISPDAAKNVRSDLIIATGRADYPNQVNNVLCFPYLFRGALDVRAKEINLAMMNAAVDAIAQLAHEPIHPQVLQSYKITALEFGPEYIVPMPLDPRLKLKVSGAVARAAVLSGVARLPLPCVYELHSLVEQ